MDTRPLLLVLALLAPGLPAEAQPASPPPEAGRPSVNAFLNITPKRVTLDKTRRIASVFLLNQGSEPVTVDVALVDRVMLADGQIFAADDAAAREGGPAAVARLASARGLLQVSPRRATLQPGRPQTVRLRLATLPDQAGEFRSHLTVTTLPPRETGATAEAAAGPAANELSFRISTVFGLSVPVIVRNAEPDVAAAFEGVRLEFMEVSVDGRAPPRRTAVVALDLVRRGKSSVYGNFEVRVAGAKKDAEPLGIARGVGVYPEVDRRAVRIPLTRVPAPGEALELTFTDDDTSPGTVLAKAAL